LGDASLAALEAARAGPYGVAGFIGDACSMLTFFRRALRSWAVLGLLGLVMVAFIVTGVGTPSSMNALGGVSGSDAVQVGDRGIAISDLNDRLKIELNQRRQQQPDITMQQMLQEGTLDKLLSELTDLTSIRAFGEKFGMVVSNRLADGEIASIPAFQGATGKFDESRYRQLLGQRGLTEAQFRSDIEQGIAVRHMLVPVAASSGAPRDLAAPYASLLVERRAGSFIELPNAAFINGPAPTDAELNAFYAANRTRYIEPERRVIRYALVDRSMIAKQSAPTDAEVAARFKQDAAKYATRQLLDITQVIVQSEATAKALAAKARSGASMDEAAKAAGGDAVPLTALEKSAYIGQSSEAIANAVFAAPKGGIVGPLKSALGWYVVKVDNAKTIGGKTLAEAKPEIVAALTIQKTADGFANLLADIEDAVSDGQTFDDVTKARGLTVVTTPPLTASGLSPDQAGFVAPENFLPVVKDAFQAEPDDDPALVPLAEDKDVFYDIDRVLAEAPKPLAKIKAQVTGDFIADRASKAARRMAEAILIKANKGTPLAVAAAGQGSVRPLASRRMDIVKGNIRPPVELVQLFELNTSRARIAPMADKQGWVVVQLDRIEPGNLAAEPSLLAATQSQLSDAIGREYTAQFTTAAKKMLKVERNESAIDGLRKSLTGAAAR
jgi:peptidyl-prolyl cis-trans isomerase D